MKISRRTSMFVTLSLLTSLVVGFNAANAAPTNLPTPPDQAIGYWTEERLQSAQPIELLVDSKTKVGTIHVSPSRTSQTATTSVPTVDNWPDGNPLAQTAVGKVFFSIGRSNYVCSGALAKDSLPGQATVLTAGHCVWNQAVKGAFVTNWAFIPNYDDGSRVKWYSSALVVRKEFASQSTFNLTALANDWGFAVLYPNSKNKLNPSYLPDDCKVVNNAPVNPCSLESNSYIFNSGGFSDAGEKSQAFGYPQASPYDGLSLRYAYASIFNDPGTAAVSTDVTTATTWGMSSNMTGGASGGPWLRGSPSNTSDNSSSTLSSVNSYKYNSDTTKMYGPKFGSRTLATWNAALNGLTGNTIVGP